MSKKEEKIDLKVENREIIQKKINTKDGKKEVKAKIIKIDPKSFMDSYPHEKDEIKRVYEHIGAYSKAVKDLAEKEATEKMKKDKKLEQLDVVAPFGPSKKDKITVNVNRNASYYDQTAKEMKTKPRMSITTNLSELPTSASIKRSNAALLEELAD